MSIVRVGTTKKYADGWEAIFGNKSKRGGGERGRSSSVKGRKKTGGRRKK